MLEVGEIANWQHVFFINSVFSELFTSSLPLSPEKKSPCNFISDTPCTAISFLIIRLFMLNERSVKMYFLHYRWNWELVIWNWVYSFLLLPAGFVSKCTTGRGISFLFLIHVWSRGCGHKYTNVHTTFPLLSSSPIPSSPLFFLSSSLPLLYRFPIPPLSTLVLLPLSLQYSQISSLSGPHIPRGLHTIHSWTGLLSWPKLDVNYAIISVQHP